MQEIDNVNTSGQGTAAVIPEEIKGWNWASFLMGPFWSIGHSVWIGLLCFVPYVGWVMSIVLGIKGSEWAWQNRKFESVEQYRQIQKIWTKWGIGFLIASVLIGIIYGIVGGMMLARQGSGISY